MRSAPLTSVRLPAAIGLVACLGLAALAGCGGGSSSSASDETTTTTTKAATSGGDSTTPTSGGSTSGGAAPITFKTICDFATGAEMSTAAGVNGLVPVSNGVPSSEHPEALCVYDNPASPTSSGIAALSYDPSLSASTVPKEHDLPGFAIEIPSAQDIQFGAAHPGTGRGIVKVTWTYAGHPVTLRINEGSADGAKTIAEAQAINAKFPS